MLKVLTVLLVAAPLLLIALGQLGGLKGRQPVDLGVQNGRLKSPSLTPNSVSSQAALYPGHPQATYAAISPMPLKHDDGPASIAALANALRTMPGVTIVEQRPDYLYAQATTRWLKFTDDLEFWFNPAMRVIELRSASRLGRLDFGANRQRIEALRTIYQNP